MGILKDLKRKKNLSTIKICPQCKEPELQKTTYGSFTNTENYKCKNCGYQGSLYLEVNNEQDDNSDKILEKLKKKFPEYIESENTDKD